MNRCKKYRNKLLNWCKKHRNKSVQLTIASIIISHTHAPLQLCIVAPQIVVITISLIAIVMQFVATIQEFCQLQSLELWDVPCFDEDRMVVLRYLIASESGLRKLDYQSHVFV